MPMLRGIRTLNSVAAGTTLAAALETLLADNGRKDDFVSALNVRTQARRAANSALTVTAVAGSARAFDSMLLSAPGVDEFAGNANAFNTFKASAALVTKIVNSVYGFKRWYRQLTWKQKSVGTVLTGNANVSEIAYGAGLYVAVGVGGAISTSPDLVTWTARTSGTAVTLASVCFGGGVFVTIGIQGFIATSPDGITWTARTLATSAVPGSTDRVGSRVCYGNGRWVASYFISGTGVYTAYTADSTTWTTGSRPNTGTTDQVIDMAFGNGYFIGAGVSGGTGTIFRSTDGQTWVIINLPVPGTQFTAVAFDPITASFAVKGFNYSSMYGSPDGLAWTRYAMGETAQTSDSVKSIYFSGVFFYRNGNTSVYAGNDLAALFQQIGTTAGLTITGFSVANGIPIAHGPAIYTLY